MDGCLPSEAERLGPRGEMLFFFSEYLLGLSVVHSSLRNPLALPVLALFSVSFFLYPQSGFWPALDFYNWRTEVLHFPPVSGDKLTEMPL